jgi:uncharacterized protein (DUF983 family)
MEDSVEGTSQQLSAAIAFPVCPKCKANVRLTETFLKVNRNVVVHKDSLSEPQAQDRPALLVFSLD